MSAATWRPELLEREGELRRLESLMREARAGAGKAVLIEAAAGLGKTRLLERIRGRAVRAGMPALGGRATELEREFPYGVVRQLFEPLLADAGSDADALLEGPASAARTALGLDPEVAAGAPVSDDPSFSVLYGLFWLTVSLSDSGPLLLTVDDAQWSDTPSLQFLMFLAPRVEELPILLTAASRPSEPGEPGPLAQLAGDPAVIRLSPAPLTLPSSAKLLAGALGAPPDPAFSAACQELTGGNPFLLTELARTLAAEGTRPIAANASVVAELVPERVARAVLLRLARLPTAVRALARGIAILGDGCEPLLAAELGAVDAPDVADATDGLRAAEILDRSPPLRFTHPLVRNAVYAEIPAGARERDHRRAAALLAENGRPPERIAIHLLATEPAADAGVARTLYEAARTALAQGAPQPAITYLLRALREPPGAEMRPGVVEALVTAAFRAADTSALAPLEAELLEEVTADPERLMRSGAAVATWLIAMGRVGEGASMLERAIDAAERAGDLGLAVALELQLTSFTQLPPARARERFERYEGRLAEDTAERRLELALRAWWSSLLGDSSSEAADLARRALAGGRIFAERPESPASPQAILVLARADDLAAAGKAAEQLIAAAAARGAVGGLAIGWFVRGYAAHRSGELRSAEADARQAVDVARLKGFLGVFPLFSALLIDVLVERDELEAAEHELQASGMAGDIPDGYWLGPLQLSRGRLRLAQGRARESADDLLDLRDRMRRWEIPGYAGTPAAAYAALALSALGDSERALALTEEELATARRWGAPSAIGEVLTAQGVVTGGERGIRLLEEAVVLLETAPTRLLLAGALTELGAALRRERRSVDARRPLRRGLALARRCGGIAVARRAADELVATGERVARYTPIGVDALTPSERRVAEMAARGMTNREIATTLYVTIKTVESHLRATYDKLGVRSRRKLSGVLTT